MDPKYHLGEYEKLTEQQKAMIASTLLYICVAGSGHFSSAEVAMQEIVRTHNEEKQLDDIINLFEQHPDIFKPAGSGAAQSISVMRPVRLKM